MNLKYSFYSFILVFQIAAGYGWIFTSFKANSYRDYTHDMSDEKITGYLVGFADFNADRAVDVFILNDKNNEQTIEVILMKKEESAIKSRKLQLFKVPFKDTRSIILGDFCGNSTIDVLSVNGPEKGPYTLNIAYGKLNRDGVLSPIAIDNAGKFVIPPLHLDWNADMIGDIFGENDRKEFILLLGQKDGSFKKTPLDNKIQDVRKNFDTIEYMMFVDVDANKQADILLVGLKDSKITFSSIIKKGGAFSVGPTGNFDKKISKFSQPSINDFSFNGKLKMLIPVCEDTDCLESRLLLCGPFDRLNKFDNCKNIGFNNMNYIWAPPSYRSSLLSPAISQINCGDINLNGYKDCFTVMANKVTNERRLFQLENMRNDTFQLTNLIVSDNVVSSTSQVAVFDLEEDGIPDLMISTNQSNIVPLQQTSSSTGDSYFIKVMMLNGLCNMEDNCPDKTLPFGIPLPGVSISYSTESATEGTSQLSIDTLTYDSAYSSLQLPYSFFGLGQFANYIEKLYASIPFNEIPRNFMHSFIVPKTQIVIIPYPLDSPDKWTNKLFLEPFHNRKVIYVAAALLGTMLVVAIIVCILQYLEVKQDRLERAQESQKFHFDAM